MEDAQAELEALLAIYGDRYCNVLSSWPPHARLLLKPRTAEDVSQQFVEAVLVLKATESYPAAPPVVGLEQCKGLDERRQKSLLSLLTCEASNLLDEPMLVALAEAAIDFLTRNNYPDGECCFCLLPLKEDDQPVTIEEELSFIKLTSCFHCFHRVCFAKWWTYMFPMGLARPSSTFDQELLRTAVCPVCRARIDAKDVESVADTRVPSYREDTFVIPESLLQVEAVKQVDYYLLLEQQRARGGLVEKQEDCYQERAIVQRALRSLPRPLPFPAPPRPPPSAAAPAPTRPSPPPPAAVPARDTPSSSARGHEVHRPTGQQQSRRARPAKSKAWVRKGPQHL